MVVSLLQILKTQVDWFGKLPFILLQLDGSPGPGCLPADNRVTTQTSPRDLTTTKVRVALTMAV